MVESERELSEVVTYDAGGNLIERGAYDKGHLFETSVYSYLDGDRVVKTEMIPGGRVSFGGVGPGPSAKRDSRYSVKFKYEHDPQGNRIEVLRIRSDGALASRSVRSYDVKGNRIEEGFYRPDGYRYGRLTHNYDAHGNVTESFHDLEGDRFDRKYSYTYEFDAKGNWTRRVTSEWVTKEGKSFFEPYLVAYRKIAYF